MRILVTGGAGFIGSTIVDAYVRKGHKVCIVDNESSGKRAYVNPNATYAKLDIGNKAQLRKLFRKYRFDVINHHAAQIDVRRSVTDPQFDAQVNVLGTLNLLTLAREIRVKKVLFSSSGGTIYGECTRPARESDPERPLSPYGITKLAGEKYIQSFSALYGIKYTIFRYSNVFGPRQDPFGEAGVVAIFSSRLLKDEPCVIFGNGKQTRDFVFVEDVARANVLALNKGHNEILNIGTGVETSVRQLYRAMARILQVKRAAVHKPARKGELDRSVLSIDKVKRVLGWNPLFSLPKGLERTIQFFSSGLS